MTASQQIKNAVLDYLAGCDFDTDLTLVDGKQRAEIALPTLAVEVAGIDSHSSALSMVHRAEVVITLRSHSGDESLISVETITDQVETALYDNSAVAASLTDADLTVYEWIYSGSQQEWDESVLEVSFAVSALIQRLA